jgi:hypothetical protein
MKQDPKFISAKQKYEIRYIARYYGIPKEVVADVVWYVGVSRAITYKILEHMGYVIKKVELDSRQRKKYENVLTKMGRNG